MKKDNPLYEVKGETLVICLPEELDHHTAGKIRENTDELFLGRKIRNVIFDYRQTVFMDSSGIGLIMGRYKKVMFIGGKAAVTNVGKTVDRIFKVSGLYKIIEKYDTIQEAFYENRI